MKKSTLITTIAMIVVVVVALSTATYAWFSSSTSAVATSSTISTTASADWTLADARNGESANDYIINAASDTITLNDTNINRGLWTPVNAISTTFNDQGIGASGSISGNQTFITAKKSGNQVVYDSTESIRPDILKVTNSTSSDKHLKLSVVLNAGNDTTRVASFYACAAVRFYVEFEVINKDQNAETAIKKYIACNQFATAKANGYSDSGLQNVAASRVAQSTFEDKNAAPAAGVTDNKTVIANINYNNAPTVYTGSGTPTGFAVPEKWGIVTETQLAQYGVAATDYIYVYDYEIPEYVFSIGDAANILLFTWIDGWTAQAEAGGASFKVSYAFNTGSAVS